MQTIPVADLAKLVEVENVKEDPDWIAAAAKVREGLGTAGFLYLVNHGIPQEVISNVFSQSQDFFKMDAEVKLKYKKDTTLVESGPGKDKTFSFENYVGYTPQGGERLNSDAKFELKETYDWLHVEKRDFYPDAELPQFIPDIVRLDAECKRFLKKLLRLLAISLELDDVDFFLKCCRHFDDPKNYTGAYNIRLLHYPPLETENEEALQASVRCAAHTDYGFLTMLFQDETGGLEVQNVDGEWIEAKPIPGSILVNTGDLIEFWTCGIFPATPHRVGIPDVNDGKRRRDRYSVAFFNSPDTDVVVTPMEMPKKPKELERLAKTEKVYSKDPINSLEYLMSRVAQQYI